jgi:hypothetical protein
MNRILRCAAIGLTIAVLAPLSQATQIITSAGLAGTNENPSNSSPGAGTALVTLDTIAHQLRVGVTFSGLTTNSTAAHIHCCVAPPNNVGVATTMPAFVGFPLGVTSGSLDAVYDTLQSGTWNPAFVTANGGTSAGAEAALAAGLAAGQAYLNIHTTQYPAGEIRGFLKAQALPNAGNIPTLSLGALVMLVVLLAAATFLVRQRRG